MTKRSEYIAFRLTPNEKRQFKQVAATEDVPMSRLFRRMLREYSEKRFPGGKNDRSKL